MAEAIDQGGRPTKEVVRFLNVLAALMAGLAVVSVMLWRWTPTWTAVLGLLLATLVVLHHQVYLETLRAVCGLFVAEIRRKRFMRMRGLEPPRGFPHTDLNRARLPIPPHPRARRILARGLHAVRDVHRPRAEPGFARAQPTRRSTPTKEGAHGGNHGFTRAIL